MLDDLLKFREKKFNSLATGKPNSLFLLIFPQINFYKEPSLTEQQLESLAFEVERIEKVFKTLLAEQPLEFALSVVKESPDTKTGPKPKIKRREYVFLMKELTDQRTLQIED